jgi:hypothetical protein
MKFSTFLFLPMIGAIAFILIRTNPGPGRANSLSQERDEPRASEAPSSFAGRNENPRSAAAGPRFELSGRVTQRFRDGHVLINGTLSEVEKGSNQVGEFVISGRSDLSLMSEGASIHCEVHPEGTYDYIASGGFTRTVPKFIAVSPPPGAARAGEWMDQGSPLNRGPYNLR